MKRDMDLVRKILFAIEDQDYVVAFPDILVIDGYDESAVKYHLTILSDSPYVLGREHRGVIDEYWLTWQGHEFLESIRDDTRWKQLMEASNKAGAASVEAIAKAALAMGIKLIFGYVGLPT